MKSRNTLSPQEKIARLRATFLEQLPGRILQARLMFERFSAQNTDAEAIRELHRILHSIKGTGRSFGFPDLGAAAALGEELASLLLDPAQNTSPEHWREQLTNNLEFLALTAEVLCTVEQEASSDQHAPHFVLSVPLVQGAQIPGRLVYVCDDEPLQVQQLAGQLECFGYQPVTFTDLGALRQAVLAKPPDAVVMDIRFPEGCNAGTEVIEELRRQSHRHIPVVFLSGRDDFEARLLAVQAGGEAYFHKSVPSIDLIHALDSLTHQKEPCPYRIMVVDDEPEIAAYHSIILQEAGMITYQLTEAPRILEALREFHPDMLLMDMYMPCCSGADLAKLVRQVPDYIALPIVYLSSETDRSKQFSAMRIGAEDFLTKPVVPDELVTAVTIRADRLRTLRALMVRDNLTGLLNHTATTQHLHTAFYHAERNNGSLCFAMIDLDHFKRVNDLYGHAMGDQVILALTRVLQQRLRHSDVVGRFGGEEFAVILDNVPAEQAVNLLDQLREDFSRVVFHSGEHAFGCTFSAGVASYQHHRQIDSLQDAADRALHRAKRAGRNLVFMDQEAA